MGELSRELYIFERKRGMKDSEIRAKYGVSDFAMRKFLKEFNVPKDELNIEPVRKVNEGDIERISLCKPDLSLKGKQVYVYDLSVKCVAYYGYIVLSKGKYNCVEIVDIKELQERNKNYTVFSDLIMAAEKYAFYNGYAGVYQRVDNTENMDNVFRTAQYEIYVVGKEKLIAKVFNKEVDPIQAVIASLKAEEAAKEQAKKEELLRKQQEEKEARKQAKIDERLRPAREYQEHIQELYKTMRTADEYEVPPLKAGVNIIEGFYKRLYDTKEAHSEIYKKAFVNKDSYKHMELIWNDLTAGQLYDLRSRDGMSYKAIAELFKFDIHNVDRKVSKFKEELLMLEAGKAVGKTFHLQPIWFEKIKAGEKKIELRINTEKIQRIRRGDTLTFINEDDETQTLEATVVDKYEYKTFYELLSNIDFADIGCKGYTMDYMISVMSRIYTPSQELKFGAVGIRMCKL